MSSDQPDVFVSLDRWQELLRLAAVMGYPTETQQLMAAAQAVTDHDHLTVHYDLLDPVVTADGVLIRCAHEMS